MPVKCFGAQVAELEELAPNRAKIHLEGGQARASGPDAEHPLDESVPPRNEHNDSPSRQKRPGPTSEPGRLNFHPPERRKGHCTMPGRGNASNRSGVATPAARNVLIERARMPSPSSAGLVHSAHQAPNTNMRASIIYAGVNRGRSASAAGGSRGGSCTSGSAGRSSCRSRASWRRSRLPT